MELDAWIDRLYACKPLTEIELRLLCEKVLLYFIFILYVDIINSYLIFLLV